MTEIVVISDIHNELYRDSSPISVVPHMDDENEKILVIAGDLGVAHLEDTWKPFLENFRSRFREVLYVPGNHEFYGSDINEADSHLLKECNRMGVFYSSVRGLMVEFDGVRFVLHPLFSDMGNSYQSYVVIKNCIADFQHIRNNDLYLMVEDYVDMFHQARVFIKDMLNTEKNTVVVTHWTPSYQSVPERFKGQLLNAYFSNHLDNMIEFLSPDVWIHGHTHDAFDYNIADTRVVCNPRGYPFEQSNGYEENKIVVI